MNDELRPLSAGSRRPLSAGSRRPLTANTNQALDPFSAKVQNNHSPRNYPTAEDTPAYAIFQSQDLLCTSYRKDHFDYVFDQDDLEPNSTRGKDFMKKWKWGVYWTPGCGLILYKMFNKEVIVPPGHICCFTDEHNNYIFARPGIHNIQNPFIKQVSNPISLNGADNQRTVIQHGDRWILTVPQGMLGYATDMGEPILLPPGLHCWRNETMRFERMCRLDDEPVLKIGPFTVLTVDEGYAAITMNNGKREILDGGQTHLLTHQKWKFERFINVGLQHDDLEKVIIVTSDKIQMYVDATVIWKITNVERAGTMLSESIIRSDISTNSDEDEYGGVSKLRQYVLQQVIGTLALFIGGINYADALWKADRGDEGRQGTRFMETDSNLIPAPGSANSNKKGEMNTFYDSSRLDEGLIDANQTTSAFGVEIMKITIVSVNPTDPNLANSFTTGAIATAEALQAETQARGMAKAMKIEAEAGVITRKINAESEAKVTLIRAKAEAEADVLRSDGAKAAEITRAEGLREAAMLLESSKIAVNLETIKTSAMAIKDTDKFFFGQEPAFMPNMLSRDNDM